ncbi:MAG: calcium/sodium antiporter [Gammaproteobacteria bacterium]|nr:calcium/sodium antiporter [Gammaproteobacteria bacterium]
MWIELLAIAGGFALLTWSADRFVVGASALAFNLNISPLIIGLTIVGLGTSAPEILVSGVASWQGNTGLAIGNAIGSNITNSTLILGVTALALPLSVNSSILRRELPILLLVMTVALLLLSDGTLGRLDGAILLTGMGIMLVWMISLARNAQSRSDPLGEEFAEEIPTDMSMAAAMFWLVTGSLLLLVSSRMLVWGSVSIAHELGVSDLVIGLTIVALGTSLPELAASVMSAIKNEHDIAIGNVIGSNIFNLLAVLGLPGLIHPSVIDSEVLTRDYPIMIVLTLLMFAMAYGFRGPGRINRLEGAIMVGAYAAYQTLLYFNTTG